MSERTFDRGLSFSTTISKGRTNSKFPTKHSSGGTYQEMRLKSAYNRKSTSSSAHFINPVINQREAFNPPVFSITGHNQLQVSFIRNVDSVDNLSVDKHAATSPSFLSNVLPNLSPGSSSVTHLNHGANDENSNLQQTTGLALQQHHSRGPSHRTARPSSPAPPLGSPSSPSRQTQRKPSTPTIPTISFYPYAVSHPQLICQTTVTIRYDESEGTPSSFGAIAPLPQRQQGGANGRCNATHPEAENEEMEVEEDIARAEGSYPEDEQMPVEVGTCGERTDRHQDRAESRGKVRSVEVSRRKGSGGMQVAVGRRGGGTEVESIGLQNRGRKRRLDDDERSKNTRSASYERERKRRQRARAHSLHPSEDQEACSICGAMVKKGHLAKHRQFSYACKQITARDSSLNRVVLVSGSPTTKCIQAAEGDMAQEYGALFNLSQMGGVYRNSRI
ncbi:hypothetical protein BT69DRAFT_1359324 [Atractiella rhizophila]|nr:hypothetical protein BT69DRAFT_1359324 [Atractiella rhizophila]